MSTTAQYAVQPTLESVTFSTANTDRTGASGSYTLVCSGPATAAGSGVGKRIERVVITRTVASSPTSSTVVAFFLSYDGGTTKFLITEWNLIAYTASTTSSQVVVFANDLTGLVLPGSTGGQAVQLYASTQAATAVNVTVQSALL
jgi:hypothetical protein